MNRKIKQFGISMMIVVSLFVASVSACACPHHQEKTEEKVSSCHHDSSMAEMENAPNGEVSAQTALFVPAGDCNCLQPAPKLSAKSETLKIDQQMATISAVSPVESVVFATLISHQTTVFEPPFYLSDSFHNLSPGRAPPRL